MTPKREALSEAELIAAACRGLHSDDDQIWIDICTPVIAKALDKAEATGFRRGMQRAVRIAQGGNKKREPWNGQTIAAAIRAALRAHEGEKK